MMIGESNFMIKVKSMILLMLVPFVVTALTFLWLHYFGNPM